MFSEELDQQNLPPIQEFVAGIGLVPTHIIKQLLLDLIICQHKQSQLPSDKN